MAYTDLPRQQLYWLWKAMRRRCSDPRRSDYAFYGGRGIRVCTRWEESFAAFADDVGPRPPGTELDRINNDGDYETGNVRWASHAVQTANRRRSKRSLTLEQEAAVCAALEAGETRVALAAQYGVLPVTISRIYERAFR